VRDPGFDLVSSETRPLPWKGLLLAVLIVTLVFSLGGLARYWAGRAHFYDFAYANNLAWNAVHEYAGRMSWVQGSSRNFGHFSPFFYALAQAYRLIPRGELFVVLQSFFLALAILPCYCLGRRLLPGSRGGWYFVGLYLTYPGTLYWNLFDFKPVIVVLPFLLFGALGVVRNNPSLAWGAFVLACSGKETVCVTVAWLGLVCLVFWPQRRRLGLGLLLLGGLWFIVVVGFVIPDLQGTTALPAFSKRWGHLGGSATEVARFILTNPGAAISSSFTWSKFATVLLFLTQSLGSALLVPTVLLVGLPYFIYGYLESTAVMLHVKTHYQIVFYPWLLIATGLGLHRLRLWLNARDTVLSRKIGRRLFPGVIICSALLSLVLQYCIPQTPNMFTPHSYVAHLTSMLALIPDNASVWAQESMFLPFCHRRYVSPYGNSDPEVPRFDYIVLDVRARFFAGHRLPWRLEPPKLGPYEVSFTPLELNDLAMEYEICFVRDGVVILRHDDTRVRLDTLERLEAIRAEPPS